MKKRSGHVYMTKHNIKNSGKSGRFTRLRARTKRVGKAVGAAAMVGGAAYLGHRMGYGRGIAIGRVAAISAGKKVFNAKLGGAIKRANLRETAWRDYKRRNPLPDWTKKL